MATATTTPTVALRIGTSTMAFDERGEILETVDYLADGSPDWTESGICDHRGGGGAEGFKALHVALTEAEKNARLIGFEVTRVPSE